MIEKKIAIKNKLGLHARAAVKFVNLANRFGSSVKIVKDGQVEIITGVNLPMLIKFVSLQRSNNLREVARKAVEQGKKNIHLASALLHAKQ